MAEVADPATGELVDADRPVRCAWPNCRHGDDPETAVLLSEDGEEHWCLCHFGDDALPRLWSGPLGQCARCGQTTSTQTEDGVHLHPDCRRIWAMAQDARPAKGAYARKRLA